MTSQKEFLVKDSSVTLKAFNNPDCSDVVFLVNDSKYYAYRKLVAGASTFFQTLLEGKFIESSQTEISLNNVMTYEDNFLIVLKFIHGFSVNLKELSNLQVCDLLNLSEYFDMANLKKEVETYLTMLEFCDIDFDSAVTLINIAFYNNYDNLYNTAKAFIFANAEYLLTQSSFLKLDYDVLIPLLESDSFFADELNIFFAVLEWYEANSADMVNSDSASNNSTGDNSSASKVKNESSEDEGIGNSTLVTTPSEETEPVQKKNLKNLIKYVRNAKVDLLYLLQVLKNGEKVFLISKYWAELAVVRTSTSNLPRKFDGVSFAVKVHAIEKIKDGFIKSAVYLIKNMKWKLKVQWSTQTDSVNVFLKCTTSSSSQNTWLCNASCTVNIITSDGKSACDYFMKYSKYKFSADNNQVCMAPLCALSVITISHRTTYQQPDGSLKLLVTIVPDNPIINPTC